LPKGSSSRRPGLYFDGSIGTYESCEGDACGELGQALRVDLATQHGFEHLRFFEDAGK
jgi:hypothetical protein